MPPKSNLNIATSPAVCATSDTEHSVAAVGAMHSATPAGFTLLSVIVECSVITGCHFCLKTSVMSLPFC